MGLLYDKNSQRSRIINTVLNAVIVLLACLVVIIIEGWGNGFNTIMSTTYLGDVNDFIKIHEVIRSNPQSSIIILLAKLFLAAFLINSAIKGIEFLKQLFGMAKGADIGLKFVGVLAVAWFAEVAVNSATATLIWISLLIVLGVAIASIVMSLVRKRKPLFGIIVGKTLLALFISLWVAARVIRIDYGGLMQLVFSLMIIYLIIVAIKRWYKPKQ